MLGQGKEILSILNTSGGDARFVGGSVRNTLAGREASDIDIACNLVPEEVTEVLENAGVRVIPTGIDFGTVTAVYEGKNYEITSLRADLNCDGRHASVQYTKDFKTDAERRDFTFNAIYMDIDEKIYDFFNGQEDLKNGVVRFIGKPEERIKEDYLRILRLFRFHAYYGKGNILPNQIDACKSLCNGLDNISGERIRAEMVKLLSSPTSFNAVNEMVNCGVLSRITGVENSDLTPDALKGLSEIYESLKEKPNPVVAMCALFSATVADEKVEAVFDRWRLSNKEKSFFERLRESLQLDFNDDFKVRNSARINGKDEFLDYIALNYAKGRITKAKAEQLIPFAKDFAVPEFPVKSEDLFRMGLRPGVNFGKVLREAEEIWERSNYTLTKEKIFEKVQK